MNRRMMVALFTLVLAIMLVACSQSGGSERTTGTTSSTQMKNHTVKQITDQKTKQTEIQNKNKVKLKNTVNQNDKNHSISQGNLANVSTKAHTSLTLPNGKVIKKIIQPVRWKDLSIQLLITSPTASKQDYKGVIGNHSTVLSHQKVSTSGGQATLVLNERTQPAAAQSNNKTYEYWVIVNKSSYTYAIEAEIVGNRHKAKKEIMQLLDRWKVPKDL